MPTVPKMDFLLESFLYESLEMLEERRSKKKNMFAVEDLVLLLSNILKNKRRRRKALKPSLPRQAFTAKPKGATAKARSSVKTTKAIKAKPARRKR